MRIVFVASCNTIPSHATLNCEKNHNTFCKLQIWVNLMMCDIFKCKSSEKFDIIQSDASIIGLMSNIRSQPVKAKRSFQRCTRHYIRIRNKFVLSGAIIESSFFMTQPVADMNDVGNASSNSYSLRSAKPEDLFTFAK